MTGSQRPLRRLFLRALLLAVLPTLLVGPALLPGRALLPQTPGVYAPFGATEPAQASSGIASDTLSPILTDAIALRRAVHDDGNLLWTPQLGLGQPLYAGSLVSLAYPPNWAYLVLAPERAIGVVAWLALWLAGLGMLLFLGGRQLAPAAAWVGVFSFQSGGFALIQLSYAMKVHAALWLPFALAAIDALPRAPRRARLQLTLALALSLCAGFAPIAFFVWFSCACYGAVRIVRADAGRAAWAARALAAAGCAALLSALFWLPQRAAQVDSARAPQSVAALAHHALPRCVLATTFLPHLFGSPETALVQQVPPLAPLLCAPTEAERALSANGLEWNAYFSVSGILLALVAMFAAPQRALPVTLTLLLLFGFALGWPPAHLVYALPGFNLGAPGRILAIAWCVWPLLVALGAEQLFAGQRRALAALAAGGALTALLSLPLIQDVDPAQLGERIVARLEQRFDPETVRTHVSAAGAARAAADVQRDGRQLGLAALFVLGAAISCALVRRRVPAAPLGVYAAVWFVPFAFEGAALARQHLVPANFEGALFDAERPPPAIAAIAAAAGGGRVVRFDTSASGVGDVMRLARPNLLQPYGIADLTPYALFPARRLVELVLRVDAQARYRSGVSRISQLDRLGHPLLDLMRVTCVLSTKALDHPRLEEAWSGPEFYVYRRTGDMPAARVYPTAFSLPESEILTVLEQGAIDPHTNLFVTGPLRSREARLPDWSAGTVQVAPLRDDRRTIEVRGSGGGWLTVFDAYDPDWQATVDGKRTQLYPAFHGFCAVRVPSGDATVVLRYRPRSVTYGLFASGLGLLLALLALRRQKPAGART